MSVILELTRIVQTAAEAENAAERVKTIVDSIQAYMGCDVSSLYLVNPEGDMTLTASCGLSAEAVGRVIIPAGKGLVGLVAESRHPVNVADAASHPAFYPVAVTEEHHFASFFGVPLVKAGRVIGVLVVQSVSPRILTDEEAAFLVTLASQLALVVTAESISGAVPAGAMRVYPGIRGAPGIGIGRLRLCDGADLFSVSDSPCEDVPAALLEWQRLVATVLGDVKTEQQNLGAGLSRDVAAIFDAYCLLLSDPALLGGVEQAIREGHCLPSALRRVIQHHAEVFLALEDPYLRARHEDIRHLGNKLYSAWRGMHTEEEPFPPGMKVVLLGGQVSVSDIARVPMGQLAAIVCRQGSNLSHTAVLANALGVPAVMGIGEILGPFPEEPVVVDGNEAKLILRPGASVIQEYKRLLGAAEKLEDDLRRLREEPAVTLDGEKVQLFANSGLLADISPGLASGAEGLGLYRTEIPFMVSETFPSEEEQFYLYRQILRAYEGKPVYMRTLDIGGDKPLPYFPIAEVNPALGWRGIRFCLDNSSLFMSQIRAMLRAAEGCSNLRILLPMVSCTAELTEFHALLDDAMTQLLAEGVAVRKPPLGIMVEVPAAISQLSSWRNLIDFVSIGSNDLSQYLLAADRENPRVASIYDHVHPAVLQEVSRVIELSSLAGLPLSLCGEMSSDPVAVAVLLGLGVRTLSMSAAQLPRIKWLIRNLTAEDSRTLALEVLEMDDAGQIRRHVESRLQQLGLGSILR
jgi:phosphoenolpyruvate-protein phosphotransferase